MTPECRLCGSPVLALGLCGMCSGLEEDAAAAEPPPSRYCEDCGERGHDGACDSMRREHYNGLHDAMGAWVDGCPQCEREAGEDIEALGEDEPMDFCGGGEDY